MEDPAKGANEFRIIRWTRGKEPIRRGVAVAGMVSLALHVDSGRAEK
jgi:hypothetical protein